MKTIYLVIFRCKQSGLYQVVSAHETLDKARLKLLKVATQYSKDNHCENELSFPSEIYDNANVVYSAGTFWWYILEMELE